MTVIKAKTRSVTGKKVRSLRRQGDLPAVLYGEQEKAQNLSVPKKEFIKAWRAVGESSLLSLELDGGGMKNVLIHDVALDPVSDVPIHVDFYAVRMDKPIEATVPLVFAGEAEAVKALGGVLVKVIHEIEVEALPKDLPHEITVDISSLKTFEDQVLVGDIKLPQGVTALLGKESVVALVEPPRSEAEMEALDQKQEAASLEEIEIAGKKPKEEETEEAASEE